MFISKLGCDNRGTFFVIMKYEEFKAAHLSGTELFNIANHKIIERNSIIGRRQDKLWKRPKLILIILRKIFLTSNVETLI